MSHSTPLITILEQTCANYNERPILELVKVDQPCGWSLCLPIPVPVDLASPTLLSLEYTTKYDYANKAIIQTDLVQTRIENRGGISLDPNNLGFYHFEKHENGSHKINKDVATLYDRIDRVKEDPDRHFANREIFLRLKWDPKDKLYLVVHFRENATTQAIRGLNVHVCAKWQDERWVKDTIHADSEARIRAIFAEQIRQLEDQVVRTVMAPTGPTVVQQTIRPGTPEANQHAGDANVKKPGTAIGEAIIGSERRIIKEISELRKEIGDNRKISEEERARVLGTAKKLLEGHQEEIYKKLDMHHTMVEELKRLELQPEANERGTPRSVAMGYSRAASPVAESRHYSQDPGLEPAPIFEPVPEPEEYSPHIFGGPRHKTARFK